MYNKAVLIGEICSKIQTKTIDSGKRVGSFRMVTEDPGKQYHSINCYDKTAEFADTLSEGDRIFVEGRVVTRSYQDANGTKKYITTVNAARAARVSNNVPTTEVDADDF